MCLNRDDLNRFFAHIDGIVQQQQQQQQQQHMIRTE